MEYINQFSLDLRPSDIPKVVSVKQNDTLSRLLYIQLTMDGNPFVPESGVTYTFRCRKPNGDLVTVDSSTRDAASGQYLVTDAGNGMIHVELTDRAIDMPGRCLCDLCMTSGTQRLSTGLFVLSVIASPNTL